MDQQSPAEVAVPGPWSRLDLLIVSALVVVTLAICLYFSPRGFQEGFVDMGHDGYQLRQALDLSQGRVLFKDTFDQYGPLNGYLNTVGFLALGRRLLAMKYFISGWYTAIVAVLFVMARRWLDTWLAAFSMLVWLGLAPFYNHGIMISPHAYALMFQALAVLVVLRAPRLQPGRLAVAGVLAGLSWAVKQTIGTEFLMALVAYVFVQRWTAGDPWRRTANATVALVIGFFGVVGLALVVLWARGAITDWYLQTIVFPRTFYLQGGAGRSSLWSLVWRLIQTLVEFVQLQLTQPVYWMVIRVVVLLTAVAQIWRRTITDDLLLMASVTAFLWLATYPSVNFMHQWWTASLTIAPFVLCIRRVMSGWLGSEAVLEWATVVVVALIAGSGFSERVQATVVRASTLTETLTEPPMFRGIRTTVRTRRAYEMLYRLMTRYRSDHPGAKVVSIETADGWNTGIVETLPLLSFLDDNAPEQPVYWSLPVLSKVVYSGYSDTLSRVIARERPLLVDHRNGRFRRLGICGYHLLSAPTSDFGYWYVYAPDEGRAPAECEAADVRRFQQTVVSADGAWRGRVLPASGSDREVQSVSVAHLEPTNTSLELGDPPLELVDPTLHEAEKPVDVYTWPPDLRFVMLDRPVRPVATNAVWWGGSSMVKDFRLGSWSVDGHAEGPWSYILEWPQESIAPGSYLVLRGELFEGGLQVGLLNQGAWTSYVTIVRPGAFEAVLAVRQGARYTMVVANCIMSTWWERVQRYPWRATLGALHGGFFPNRFRVSEAGWISTPDVDAAHDVTPIAIADRSRP